MTNTQFETMKALLERIADDTRRVREACERCEARATAEAPQPATPGKRKSGR